jgi:hypothetical protein
MPFADFKLVDQSGNERQFRGELADFTLVAFTRCDRDEHAQATRRLADLVAEYSDAKYVQVAGIDIHRSEAGCAQLESCHVNLAGSDLGSICDGSQAVHRNYGTGRDDWLYVIGPDRRIVLASPIDQVDDLREQLSVNVARYAAYKRSSLSSPPEDRVQ